MRHLQLFVVLGLALVGCATGTDAGVEGSGSGGEAGAISAGGGNATGGSSTGGSSTGGAQSGGSGGTVTGGQAGDTATGGTTTGGTSGTTGGTGGTTGGTGGTTGGTGGSTTGGTGGTTGGTGGSTTGGTGGTTSVSGLSVRYDVGFTGTGPNIDATLWIFNTGTTTVSLDGLTLYYYLTLTGEVDNPEPRIDWGNILPLSGGSADQVGGNLAITKQLLAPAVSTADSYFAVTFSGGKQLAPNTRLQFHWTATNGDTQSFVQTNDYSFNASYTADAGTEWDHIVLKQGSTVLWGIEP